MVIISRVISIVKGFLSLRTIVRVTSVSGSPRIRLTPSSRVIPLTGLSPIFTIRSPDCIPALYAGVSSIGDMT